MTGTRHLGRVPRRWWGQLFPDLSAERGPFAAKCPSLPHPIVTSGKQPPRRCAMSPVEPRFLGPFAPPPSPRHGSRRARWWGLTGSLTGPGIRTPAPDGDRHSGRSRGFSGCLRQGAVRTEHRKSVVNFFNTASSSFHCRRLIMQRQPVPLRRGRRPSDGAGNDHSSSAAAAATGAAAIASRLRCPRVGPLRHIRSLVFSVAISVDVVVSSPSGRLCCAAGTTGGRWPAVTGARHCAASLPHRRR